MFVVVCVMSNPNPSRQFATRPKRRSGEQIVDHRAVTFKFTFTDGNLPRGANFLVHDCFELFASLLHKMSQLRQSNQLDSRASVVHEPPSSVLLNTYR